MKPLFSFILLLLAVVGCKVTEDAPRLGTFTTDADDYKKMGSNLIRFHAMQQGYFSYQVKQEDGVFRTHSFSAENDSLMAYVRGIGAPGRDGYWLYYRLFMSSLPNEPTFQAWEYLEQRSRDSFVVHTWQCHEEYRLEELTQADFDFGVQLDQIKRDTVYRLSSFYYFRKSMLEYEGLSGVMNPIHLEHKKNYKARQDRIEVRPEHTTWQNRLYKTKPFDVDQPDMESWTRYLKMSDDYTFGGEKEK